MTAHCCKQDESLAGLQTIHSHVSHYVYLFIFVCFTVVYSGVSLTHHQPESDLPHESTVLTLQTTALCSALVYLQFHLFPVLLLKFSPHCHHQNKITLVHMKRSNVNGLFQEVPGILGVYYLLLIPFQ